MTLKGGDKKADQPGPRGPRKDAMGNPVFPSRLIRLRPGASEADNPEMLMRTVLPTPRPVPEVSTKSAFSSQRIRNRKYCSSFVKHHRKDSGPTPLMPAKAKWGA